MKKAILLTGACVALAATALAGPLTNPKGIPAESQGIIHIDLEAGRKSKIYQVVREISQKELVKDAEAKKAFEAFKKELDFDPYTDVADFTVGLVPGEDEDGAPEPVIVVRGKFSPDKLLAAAKKRNIKTVTVGKNTLIDFAGLGSAYFPGADIAGLDKTGYVAVVDKGTLILGEDGIIQKALSAYAGQSKSYATPATLAAFGKQVTAPVALVYASGDLTKGMGQEQVENIFFALGESGANALARLAVEFKSTDDATQAQAMAQMGLGVLQMSAAQTTGPDGQPDPEKVENAKKITKLVSALKINAAGKTLTVNIDYPSAEIAQAIKDEHAKSQAE